MVLIEKPQLSDIVAAGFPILYAGILSGGVAYTLQMVGQKYAQPAVASIVMSLESVFAVLAGVVILQETMTARETFGCVLMFAAVILAQLPELKKAS
jgi:drug/metabolite transporter (DMT)-like permease